jgi:predicted amidophosphoribosyltransferase
MSETLLEELADKLISGPIILIPAPLSKARRRTRGYNQAEELAQQMVTFNPQQFSLETNLIKKTKDTPTQVSIKNRAERLANLKGAFIVNPNCAISNLKAPRDWISHNSGTIFVIIDDVSTTGATIGEIRQILKKAGINRTYGLVLAHG